MFGFFEELEEAQERSLLSGDVGRTSRGLSSAHVIDPLRDPRWPAFLERHPRASVFHTAGWLEALRRTYGYHPVVVTTSPPDRPLENGIVFCRVDSWLTGARLVSVPFSDHCQPLVENQDDFAALLYELRQQLKQNGYKYIELRPLISTEGGPAGLDDFEKSEEYCLHTLDLRPGPEVLSGNFHKTCIRRSIRRAGQEHLAYESGRSEALLQKFYHLLLLTRRRHQLPPQPVAWFRNLIRCFEDNITLRVASKDGQPVASILTLSHKSTLVYKYGCSDASFHNLGGMALLFWRAIQEGKERGAQEFDLGRSEIDNEGLVRFKGRLGAACSRLTYLRYPALQRDKSAGTWKMRFVRNAFSRLPDSLLAGAGRVLYRHVG